MLEASQFLRRYGGLLAAGLAALAALLLPLNLLATQPLHHDEALYATWALTLSSGADPWLSETPIDKPPLFLLPVAGAFRLLGVTESIARLPSLLAAAAIVLLTYGLGRKLYSQATAIVAAWLVALSPFTILFAATALTDPTLVALVLAGCLAAVHGRAVWAGIFAALAIATKQQGVFFVPLIAGFLFVAGWQGCRVAGLQGCRVTGAQGCRGAGLQGRKGAELQGGREADIDEKKSSPFALRSTVRFLLSLSLSLLPLIFWDLSRSQPSAFFQQSLNNYGGLAFSIAGFGQRFLGFVELLRYGTGSSVLNTLFIVGLPLLLIYGLTQISQSPNPQSPISNLQSPIPSLQSPISNPQSPVSNLQSPIPNPQSPIPSLQSPISNLQSPIST